MFKHLDFSEISLPGCISKTVFGNRLIISYLKNQCENNSGTKRLVNRDINADIRAYADSMEKQPG